MSHRARELRSRVLLSRKSAKRSANMLSQSIPHFMVRYILRLKRLSVLSLPTDRQ